LNFLLDLAPAIERRDSTTPAQRETIACVQRFSWSKLAFFAFAGGCASLSWDIWLGSNITALGWTLRFIRPAWFFVVVMIAELLWRCTRARV
jgi:hypothetical protein